MNRTRIKICGIRRLSDALVAAEAGADAIGFNFYPESPRYVTPAEAARIVSALPAFVTTVGVSVNDPLARIAELRTTGVDLLQFHGDEDNAACEAANCPFIKVIRVTALRDAAQAREAYPRSRGLLVDTLTDGAYGGSGRAVDWRPGPTPITGLVLAGGLDPGNVGDAIRMARPFAVDVSSGVERERGTKDPDLIRAFIAAVRAADEELNAHG